eukprot:scaffold666317_cov42-Prasinocladus_malaysianus.AAC.1
MWLLGLTVRLQGVRPAGVFQHHRSPFGLVVSLRPLDKTGRKHLKHLPVHSVSVPSAAVFRRICARILPAACGIRAFCGRRYGRNRIVGRGHSEVWSAGDHNS